MSSTTTSLSRGFVEDVFNRRDLTAIDRYIAEDAIDHAQAPGLPPGRAGLHAMLGMFFTAFPDLHMTIEDEIIEGDLEAMRSTMRGTHRGEFMGIPPTGRAVEIQGIDISRAENGKLVEHWSQMDSLGLLQQLGVIPSPGQ